MERGRKEDMEKRLLGGAPVAVASCALALAVIWLWGLIHPHCTHDYRSWVSVIMMNGILINKAVIRETKFAL